MLRCLRGVATGAVILVHLAMLPACADELAHQEPDGSSSTTAEPSSLVDDASMSDPRSGEPPTPPAFCAECCDGLVDSELLARDALDAADPSRLLWTSADESTFQVPFMPPGCCDTAFPTALPGFCWDDSPAGKCGELGQEHPLPAELETCEGHWTWPVTWDGAAKYCMCMTTPNGECEDKVRTCLACMNGTVPGIGGPPPPFHPGTYFPEDSCFVVPVAEFWCFNNSGCTGPQLTQLALSVSCQFAVCSTWATAQCLAAGTC